MTDIENRLDRIEELIERIGQRQEAMSLQQEINTRVIELLGQRVDSNAQSIEATRASVDGLVQTITEFSVRSEARLNRLEDAIVGIERILEQLTRRDRDRNGDQPPQ